jgi:O-antigen ligase
VEISHTEKAASGAPSLAAPSFVGNALAAAAGLAPPLAVFAAHGLAPLFALTAIAVVLGDPRRILRAAGPFIPLGALLLALSAWATASAAWSILPLHSLLEGLRFLAIGAGGTAILAAGAALGPSERDRLLVAAITGAGLATALLLIEFWSDAALTRMMRGLSPGAYVPLARFDRATTTLALALWAPITALIARRRILVALVFGVAAVMAIFLMVSTATKLAISAGFVIFALAHLIPRTLAAALSGALVVAAVALPLATPDFRGVTALHQAMPSLKSSAIHRLVIWRFTAERIAERPYLGWGMDSSRALPGAKEHLAALLPQAGLEPSAEALPLHPHSALLQWEVELGVPGTLLCLAVIAWGLWRVGFSVDLGRVDRAGALAWATTALVVAMLSFGTWQAWWLSCVFLTASTYRGVIRSAT